jgi:hypothetical protein
MPQKSEFGDSAPPRLLVAVPAGSRPRPSRFRWFAIGAVVAGLALALGVVVAALVDRGHGTPTTRHAHNVAAPASSVVLPFVVGAGQQLATSVLQGEGFPVHVRTVADSSPAGTVVAEKPAGGRPVARSTRVLLTISNGS